MNYSTRRKPPPTRRPGLPSSATFARSALRGRLRRSCLRSSPCSPCSRRPKRGIPRRRLLRAGPRGSGARTRGIALACFYGFARRRFRCRALAGLAFARLLPVRCGVLPCSLPPRLSASRRFVLSGWPVRLRSAFSGAWVASRAGLRPVAGPGFSWAGGSVSCLSLAPGVSACLRSVARARPSGGPGTVRPCALSFSPCALRLSARAGGSVAGPRRPSLFFRPRSGGRSPRTPPLNSNAGRVQRSVRRRQIKTMPRPNGPREYTRARPGAAQLRRRSSPTTATPARVARWAETLRPLHTARDSGMAGRHLLFTWRQAGEYTRFNWRHVKAGPPFSTRQPLPRLSPCRSRSWGARSRRRSRRHAGAYARRSGGTPGAFAAPPKPAPGPP